MKNIPEMLEILSKSNLIEEILHQPKNCLILKQKKMRALINMSDIANILNSWKGYIEDECSFLFNASLNAIECSRAKNAYQQLGDLYWKRAAQISEFFKNPSLSKNATRLNAKALQKKIHACLTRNKPLVLIMGWGQAKRMAGGLKTLGSFADLAEMYAISKLVVIAKTIARIAQIPITMKILTGGSRFFEALFTRVDITELYDNQRQKIANALGATDLIKFFAYNEFIGGTIQSTLALKRLDELDKLLPSITDEMILRKFDTILLNIDWDNLFAISSDSRYKAPHGIVLPLSIRKWLQLQSISSMHSLIRSAIIYEITSKCQPQLIHDTCQDSILKDAALFMRKVTWESTRKYIALHLMDLDDRISNILQSKGENFLRLTVHEKLNKLDTPALFTLSPDAGNQLSQHVLMSINQSGQIFFGSYSELLHKNVKPVYLKADDQSSMFGWLLDQNQPLCFIEDCVNEDDVAPLISKAISKYLRY